MSAQFIWSPNDLATRTCQAPNCPETADGFWGLCTRHAKQQDAGARIPIHAVENQEPVLRCSACSAWLPDKHFPLTDKRIGGPPKDRRGRSHRCQDCT